VGSINPISNLYPVYTHTTKSWQYDARPGLSHILGGGDGCVQKSGGVVSWRKPKKDIHTPVPLCSQRISCVTPDLTGGSVVRSQRITASALAQNFTDWVTEQCVVGCGVFHGALNMGTIFIISFNCKWVFTRWQWYYNKTQHTNNTHHTK
jgi:hypothetical protein